ncbi:MAG: hypothetical protein HDS87_04985 [Bacteroidales bacterium]|nr:hypothetical protein [Bacteroidales bacterium]
MKEFEIDNVVNASETLVRIFSEHYHYLAINTQEDISYISDAIERFREISNEGCREVFGRNNLISDSDSKKMP